VVGHVGWNLGRSVFQTLGPLVAVRALGGAVAWGLIVQVGAIGAVLGAALAFRIRPRRPLVTANIALALAGLPLVLLAVQASVYVVAVAAGLMYGGLTVMQVLWQTVVQQQIPREVLSRVLAYDWLGSLGFTPLGLALAGPLAVAVGTGTTLTAAAVLLLVGCLGLLAVPEVRHIRLADPKPAQPVA
jgi:MFS family permease